MTGDITPPHEERIDPREGAVDAARVEELLETLPVNADGGTDPTTSAQGSGAQDAAAPAAPPDADSGADRVSQLEAELAALRSENE